MRVRIVSLPVLVATLVGCSTQIPGNPTGLPRPAGVEQAAPPSTGVDSTEPGASAVAGFEAGLLPADRFGPGAQAQPITAAALADNDPSRVPEGATLTPPQCAQIGDPRAEPNAFAGQLVSVGPDRLYVQLVQTPFEGTSHDPDTARAALAGCKSATLTMPDGAVVQLSQAALDLGDVGDANAGRRTDNTVVAPDGQQYVTSMLIADVVDGDRVVSLGMFSLVPNQSPDEAAFRQLVATAFDFQHDALR